MKIWIYKDQIVFKARNHFVAVNIDSIYFKHTNKRKKIRDITLISRACRLYSSLPVNGNFSIVVTYEHELLRLLK